MRFLTSEKTLPNDTDFVEITKVVFTFANIAGVVDYFYRVVAIDPVLKMPFQSVEDWQHHIKSLTHFWWIRLGGRAYLQTTYNPAEKHFLAGFNQTFLTRWLTLFQEVLDKQLAPEQARIWGAITRRMGVALSGANELYRRAHEQDMAHHASFREI